MRLERPAGDLCQRDELRRLELLRPLHHAAIHRRAITLFATVGLVAIARTLATPAEANCVNRETLEGAGWTCFAPPSLPDTVVCFEPGRGRPFAGNPDPRPSYSFLAFGLTSGEFLGTGHLIRADL